MFKRATRWNWLSCFAVCNLVFWVCVAIGVGVLVTDTLDLGVESFIRTRHATAIVAWEEMTSARLSARATTSAARALPSATVVAARPSVQSTGMPGEDLSPLSTATTLPAPARPTTVATRRVQPTLEPIAQPESTQALASVPQPQNTPAAQSQGSAATAPTPEPTVMLLSSPLLISDPDAAGLATIDAEMARSAAGRPVQIRYDEETLNGQVTAALASYPDQAYQDVHLDLMRDGVLVEGTVTVMGFQVKATVEGTLVARECRPQPEIAKISIAGLLTPGFIRDSIADMIVDSFNWYPPDYPLCVEQIVLEQDRVTIYGSRR